MAIKPEHWRFDRVIVKPRNRQAQPHTIVTISPLIWGIPGHGITPDDVEEVREWCQGHGLSRRTYSSWRFPNPNEELITAFRLRWC